MLSILLHNQKHQTLRARTLITDVTIKKTNFELQIAYENQCLIRKLITVAHNLNVKHCNN